MWSLPCFVYHPKYPFHYPSRNQVVLTSPQNQSIEGDVQTRQEVL